MLLLEKYTPALSPLTDRLPSSSEQPYLHRFRKPVFCRTFGRFSSLGLHPFNNGAREPLARPFCTSLYPLDTFPGVLSYDSVACLVLKKWRRRINLIATNLDDMGMQPAVLERLDTLHLKSRALRIARQPSVAIRATLFQHFRRAVHLAQTTRL